MAICMSPYILKDPQGVMVPCGKCPPCLKRRASGWSFRLCIEERHSLSAHFVTLTYDNEHVPRTARKYLTLQVSDIQKFFKRLRKANRKRYGKSAPTIKYFVAGEYGTRYFRPHWHAIIFNANPFDIEDSWKIDGRSIGIVDIGTVTGASVGYTLKYMCKPSKVPMHANDDRLPERQLQSKGLGQAYLTRQMKKWHYADLENRVYCTAEGNVKLSMPRYYRNKLYDDEQAAIIQVAMAARLAQKMEQMYYQLDQMRPGITIDQYQYMQEQRKTAAYRKMYRDSLKQRELF